jgi:hypothetical protein
MADQCIVCLELLDVEPGTTPPAPSQQLKELEEQLAIDVAGALSETNENAEPQHSNHDNVALIEVCGHMLHDMCLREWTEKANSCPICRQTFHVVNVYDKIGGKSATPAQCNRLHGVRC